MSEIAAQPGDVIDFSKAEMPVKIDDRSFDSKMVPELVAYLKDIRDHSLDYVVPGPKLEVKPVGASAWELWIDGPEGMKIFRPTNWAQGQTVGKVVRDVFNATLVNTDFFDQWVAEFKESKEVRPEDMTVAVHKVSEEYAFTQAEEEAIMAALMTDRTIFPEDRGTGYALINAMTVASKDMGLERMHDVAKIAGNVSKVMAVVC